jgi:hypothetical protein
MQVWVTAAVAIVAAWAWLRARRLARKLEALTQSYWELRYELTRLRSQVARLDPEAAAAEVAAPAAPPAAAVSYVSLASMKSSTSTSAVSKKKG